VEEMETPKTAISQQTCEIGCRKCKEKFLPPKVRSAPAGTASENEWLLMRANFQRSAFRLS
jgi:hypothetical protein